MSLWRIWTVTCVLAAVCAAVCRAEPTVQVILKDGSSVRAKLICFKDRVLSLREGKRERTIDAAEVREVRFLPEPTAGAPVGKGATRPPAAADAKPSLEQLEKQFMGRKPAAMLVLAKRLSGQLGRRRLAALRSQLRRKAYSTDESRESRVRYYAAYTAMRAHTAPPGLLWFLRREVRRWSDAPGATGEQREFARAVLDVVNERMRDRGGPRDTRDRGKGKGRKDD